MSTFVRLRLPRAKIGGGRRLKLETNLPFLVSQKKREINCFARLVLDRREGEGDLLVNGAKGEKRI